MKEQICNYLLDIKAIQINTQNFFTWASKIKSPIYTDNRLIMSHPKIRNLVADELAKLIKSNFKNVDFLAGVATSGIAPCAYVSEKMLLPMGYVRSSKKDHGKQNDIEGDFSNAKNIVVIEDLFSTGKSSYQVVETLRQNHFNVIGIVSIFSYNLSILPNTFKDVEYHSLVTIDDLMAFGIKDHKLSIEDQKIIKTFLNSLNK